MIAEQLNFTLKKWQAPKLVLWAGVFSLLTLSYYAIGSSASISAVMWVETIQAGLICGAIAVYHYIAKHAHQLRHSLERQANTKAQLQAAKSSADSCSKFIENIAESLREPSQEIFDAAEFLNGQSVAKNTENTDSRENNGKAIEQSLLSSAKKLHQLCNNIVDYSHLKKGSVSLVEQEIDPVELIRFCAATISKVTGLSNCVHH